MSGELELSQALAGELLAPVTVEDGPASLFAIERALAALEATGGRAALELLRCRNEVAQCERNLRVAKARAFKEAQGLRRDDGRPSTVQERDMAVMLATDEQQFQLDLAKAALGYAKDLVDERAGQRSALQTRAKLIAESMALAGYAPTSAPRWRPDDRPRAVR